MNITILIAQRNGSYAVYEGPNGNKAMTAWCPHWLAETYHMQTGVWPEIHIECTDHDCYCRPLR